MSEIFQILSRCIEQDRRLTAEEINVLLGGEDVRRKHMEEIIREAIWKRDLSWVKWLGVPRRRMPREGERIFDEAAIKRGAEFFKGLTEEEIRRRMIM